MMTTPSTNMPPAVSAYDKAMSSLIAEQESTDTLIGSLYSRFSAVLTPTGSGEQSSKGQELQALKAPVVESLEGRIASQARFNAGLRELLDRCCL